MKWENFGAPKLKMGFLQNVRLCLCSLADRKLLDRFYPNSQQTHKLRHIIYIIHSSIYIYTQAHYNGEEG